MGRPSQPVGTPEIRSVVEPVVAALGLDLEELDVQASGRRRRVSVVVDRDGGIDLDAIAEVSRAVSDALDAADAMGDDPYTLEVTSPGVDRPLTLPRHWRRNIGRRVRLVPRAGATLEGRIREVDEEGVVLDTDAKGKPESVEQRVLWPDVARGEIQVEFTRRGDRPEADDEQVADEEGEA